MRKSKITKAQRKALSAIGRIGGLKKSDAKTAAAQKNILKRWENNPKTH